MNIPEVIVISRVPVLHELSELSELGELGELSELSELSELGCTSQSVSSI